MKRKKICGPVMELPELLNDRRMVCAKLETFKEWWPNFQQFEKVYWTDPGLVEVTRWGKFQYVGHWGMFTRHYTTGHGSMIVGLISIKVE